MLTCSVTMSIIYDVHGNIESRSNGMFRIHNIVEVSEGKIPDCYFFNDSHIICLSYCLEKSVRNERFMSIFLSFSQSTGIPP